MRATLLDEVKIIDTDTHVVEPPDLWISRVSTQRWGDLVPHVDADENRPAHHADPLRRHAHPRMAGPHDLFVRTRPVRVGVDTGHLEALAGQFGDRVPCPAGDIHAGRAAFQRQHPVRRSP